MKDDNLLTAAQLASRLNVNVSWVYDRTRTGGPDKLPHLRIGKYVRFDYPTVINYLTQSDETKNDA